MFPRREQQCHLAWLVNSRAIYFLVVNGCSHEDKHCNWHISRYQYSSPSTQSVDARIGVLNDGLRNCQMCDDVYD